MRVLQINAHIPKRIELLLVDVKESFVLLQLASLLLEFFKLRLESAKTIFMLSLHQCLLVLQRTNLFFPFAKLKPILISMRSDLHLRLQLLLVQFFIHERLLIIGR